jgi:aryl-alcohol dehydrogenase-like predicted oxidoreductase
MNMKQFREPGLKLGLGLVSIGRVWGVAQSAPPSKPEAQALLSKALELDIEVFDTAPTYADSETRLGQFLAGLDPRQRETLIVMTKAGEHWDRDAGASFVDHGADALRRSIDRSLELLGSVEVLQIHKATKDVVAHPDVVAAIEHARRCGVQTFGASVSDVESGIAALESGLYHALQFPFNMANTSLSPLIPALAARNGVAIINRPFAMGGLVTGEDVRKAGARAFHFIEEHAPNGVVLTGTGRVSHLVQNTQAFRQRKAS